MPDEFEEIQPADDTLGGDLAPLESIEAGDSIDVSDSLSEASAGDYQEEIMGGAPPSGRSVTPSGPIKPKSNIFTLILILSFLCIVLAIYMIAHELNNFYGVTFGGMLSQPNKTVETVETGE
jgi:hypothetical protein